MLEDHLDKKDLKLLDESSKDNLYTGDYIEFDQFGYKYVKCIRCGQIVSYREKQKIPCSHCKRMVELEGVLMKRLPNFRQVNKDLNDGSYVAVICCEQCEPSIKIASPEEERRIEAVIKAGFIQEMEFAGRSKDHIKKFLDKRNIKIGEKK